MSEDNKFTPIKSLGEFALIDRIKLKARDKNKNTIKGIGDDASVIDVSKKESIVISTDMLIQGVHFDLMYVPLLHLGYKSVTSNLSDIYAMNAKPEQILVSIAMSNKFSVEAIEEIYEGVKKACDFHKVDLVGGDTTSSAAGLVISVTAIGRTNPKRLTYRNTAKKGDILMVSGDLGSAYLGLQVLEREKAVFTENPNMQPQLNEHQYILQRQLRPEARKDVVKMLEDIQVIPTAMIDVSDGLASEVLHICQQSKVGAIVYEEKIPIDPSAVEVACDFNINPTTCAMNGGEDYELLFTINAKDLPKFKNHPHFTSLGEIVSKEKGANLILKGGNSYKIIAQGWNSLLEKD